MANKDSHQSSDRMKSGMKLATKAKEKALKGAKKLMNQIPKAVEKSPFLQNTLTMIVEMQQQAKSIRKDANEEVHKILEVLQHSYADLEVQAKKVGDQAKKRAKGSLNQLLEKWDEKKGKLPKQFVGEMDQLLSQVGLAKTAKSSKPAGGPKKASAAKKPNVKKATAAKAKAPAKAKPSAKKTPIRKVSPAVLPKK